MAYERELHTALEAAEMAGRVILDHYARFEAIADAPASISTAADRDSQETILRHLTAAFPGDALCAEEATPTLAAAVRQGDRLWVVDPIDGTRGFARKNDEFSVMIALLEAGRIAVGVVLEPVPARCTFATRGGGCRVRVGTGGPMACRVRAVEALADAVLTQSRSEGGRSNPRAAKLAPREVRETYSAGIKLAQVARSEADVYVISQSPHRDWDVCAGDLLVTEAGGRVTDWAGRPLRYGLPGNLQRDGVIAANPRLHAEALSRLGG